MLLSSFLESGTQIQEWTKIALLFLGGIATITGLFVSSHFQRQMLQDQEFRELFTRFASPHEPTRVSALIALGSIARNDSSRTARYRSQVVPFLLLALESDASKPVRDATAYAIGQVGVGALPAVVEGNRRATQKISNLLKDLRLASSREHKEFPVLVCPYSSSGYRNMETFRSVGFLAQLLELGGEELEYLAWPPWDRGNNAPPEDSERPVPSSEVLMRELKAACTLLRGTVAALQMILQATSSSQRKNLSLHNLHLWGADLKDTDLSGVVLTSSNLGLADLRGANLRKANLSRTVMFKTSTDGYLNHAVLKGALLWDAYEGHWRRQETDTPSIPKSTK
jgi:Pentapeptide repeats (8 copies)/HEAT-like repeat